MATDNPYADLPKYDPLRNATYDGTQLVDNLTGMPVDNPLMAGFNPNVQAPAATPAANPLTQPAAPPAAPAQPAAQSPINVGTFQTQTDLFNQSAARQRELFNNYAQQQYSQFMGANPTATITPEDFTAQLASHLSPSPTNYVSIDPATGKQRDPEGGLIRNVLGTAAGSVTSLADAGAGLLNAGVSAVAGKNSVTGGIAKAAHNLNEAAESLNSPAKQDFDKQVQETMADPTKNIGDVAGLYLNHPGYAALDLAGMLGTGVGAGAAGKVALRQGEKALARSAAATGIGEGAATSAATTASNAEALARAGNILGQGGLAAGQGAQAMGQQNGDYQLTRQQSVGAGVDGLIAGLATQIGMKYGYTPESILLGATPAKITKEAVPGLMRTALKSMGVEAGSNAVQNASDAFITSSFDKNGNVDFTKTNWGNVGNAALIGAGLGGVMGGGAGVMGGLRNRRLNAQQNALEAEAAAGPVEGESPTPQPAEQAPIAESAADDTLFTEPEPVQPEGEPVQAQQAQPTSQASPFEPSAINPSETTSGRDTAFMNNPAAQDFFERMAQQQQAEQMTADLSPEARAQINRAPADALRAAQAEPVQGEPLQQALPAPETAQAAPQSLSDVMRAYYDQTPPAQRAALPGQLAARLQAYQNSPEVLEARQRDLLRQEPGYVEMNPEQANQDAQILAMVQQAQQAQADLAQYHTMQANNGLAYDATAPNAQMAQDIINERLAREVSGIAEVPTGTGAARAEAQAAAARARTVPTVAQANMEGATPQQIQMARQMLTRYRNTPNEQKQSFMDQMNDSYNRWFTRAYHPADGRTFDQLQYDAQNLTDPAQKRRAQQLYNRARGDADTRTRLKNLMDAENQRYQEDMRARQEAFASDLNNLSRDSLRNLAAETVLRAQSGRDLRTLKQAGQAALTAYRAQTPAASELARRGVPDAMATDLETTYLGLQRGTLGFARSALKLTGMPREPVMTNIRATRVQNPISYGKQTLINAMTGYEVSPNATGRTRLRTTQYLNFLQGRQDAITQAIGEWRPISLEDVRSIAGEAIPELTDIGLRDPRGQADNTRRYVNRVVNDYITRGDITPENAAPLRLLRDWLIADSSEATYQTAPEARRANVDIPSLRQLRQLRDGELLPSGKAGTGDPLNEPIPDMRAPLELGDVSGALGRAVASLPPSRAVLIRALKNVFDRMVDPVTVRISDEPLHVGDREVPAYYDRANAEIVIDTRYADRADIVGHEALHAATQEYIERGGRGRLNGRRLSAYTALETMWLEAREKPDMPENGRESLHEFVADAMSNPEMQDFLKSYNSQYNKLSRLRSTYRSFIGAVRNMVGLPPKSYSALEDIVGLTHTLVTGGEAPGSRARIVEAEGFQSGTLHRHVQDRGVTTSEEFGSLDRSDDGSFRVTTDEDSIYGATTQDFDTYADAAEFVHTEYGAEIRALSSVKQAVREGLLAQNDTFNPVVEKIAAAITEPLNRYLPENMHKYVQHVTQTILTGGRWLIMQTDRLEILNQLDRAMARIGFPTNLHGAFEQARRLNRAQMRIGADLPSMLMTVNHLLQPINRTSTDLGRYMQAMHVPERNAKHGFKGGDGDVTGFTWTDANGRTFKGDAAAKEYLASLDPNTRQVFREASQKVWTMWQDVLKEENRSGILSDAQYRLMGGLDAEGRRAEGAYEYYVPLRNDGDLDGWLTPRQGVSGRTTEAADPFAALVIQLQQRMGRVYRNDAMRELGSAMREHPIPEVAAMETYKLRWDKDGVLKKLPENVRNMENAVYWQEDGALKVMHINTETAEGRMLLKALKSSSMAQNSLIRGLGATTRVMAMMNTVLNPAFQLKTIAWDITSTLLNYQGAYGNGITASEGARLALRSVLRAGKVVGGIAKARYSNQSDNAAYNLFGKLGAGMGAGAFLNQSRVDQHVMFNSLTSNRRLLDANGMLKGSLKIAEGYGDSALHLLHSADDAIRYAGFVEYIQHKTGVDIHDMKATDLEQFAKQHQDVIDQAVNGSKEINGNFERQGNGGMLNSLYAFWNATMQGTRLFASIASSKQGQYGMMALIAMGAASALAGMSQPDDDDGAGGSNYANLRNRTSAINFGGAAIPLIYEGRLPYVLGNSAALFFSGKISAGKFMGDILHSAGDLMIPIMPMDSGDAGFSTLYAATPTAAQLAFPIFLGKNAFGGDTDASFVVGPDGKKITNPAPVETAKPATSWLARQIADGLDNVGLGSIAYPGRIDAAISQVSGGAYSTLNSMLNPSATTIVTGRNRFAAALGKDFYSQPDDFELQQKYNEQLQEYSRALRKQTGSLTGRDVLAMPQTNKGDVINKQVSSRLKAINIDGKNQSAWLQQLGTAKANGDQASAEAATAALYQLRLRQNQVYAWGLNQLKDIAQ